MRLGSNSRLKGLICYSLSAAILFSTFPRPAQANPLLIGIAEVFGSIIARRAAVAAAADVAADAAFTARVANATYKGVETAAAARKLLVPANSALRTAGKVTWGALNVAGGVMTATELLDAFHNNELSVATDGVALGNGKYEVNTNGVTQTVDFQPSPDNPVIIYGTATPTSPGTGTGTDPGTVVPRTETIKDYPVNSALQTETWPTPSNVVQAKTVDNSSAIYTFNTQTKTGDLYSITDDRMETLQNAFLTATMRNLENSPMLAGRSSTVTGDNGTFEYVVESYSVDVLDFVPQAGSKYPEVGSDFDNAVTSYTATVPYVVHHKKISTQYNPCTSVKVTEQDQTSTWKRMCTPPTEQDYTVTDEKDVVNGLLTLNFNYVGDYFKPKTDTQPAKVVTATELADLLNGTQLDNWTVADMLTDLLSEAASKSDYQGVPFTDDDYITDTEVANALKALNGTLTAASLMTSAEDKNGNIVISNTTTNIGGDTSNSNTTVEAKVDLGDDPNIKAPELEETPTGKQILAPIQESMPFLNDFKITGRDAQCPVARFSVFDHDYVIDKHCDLIEQNRKLIELFVSILWAFVALRAVLKA